MPVLMLFPSAHRQHNSALNAAFCSVQGCANCRMGGVTEARHLLVARLLRRYLCLLCALQALFSFIRNSLEMHLAMA